jgi:hypothetical protein
MWRLIILASLTACATGGAHAATCQDSFVKKGNPLGGLRFTAEVTVADLTPPTAIRQFRGIAAADGYDITVDEAEEGSMLIEQPRSPSGATRPVPIIVSATAIGTALIVKLEAKLPGGMLAPAEGVKTELCKMLNQIKGGKIGLAAANRGKSAVSSAGPTVIEALMLSQQISQEADKNAAIIPSRYTGKSFKIKGTVDYVMRDGDTYRIAYVIPKTTDDLAIRLGSFKLLTQLSCLVAKGQSAFALSLKKGNHVTLTGRFRAYDQFVPVMWFDGCRPA